MICYSTPTKMSVSSATVRNRIDQEKILSAIQAPNPFLRQKNEFGNGAAAEIIVNNLTGNY